MKSDFVKKYWLLFIGALMVLGFVLRFWNFPQQLFFGPEQGIDALIVKEMVEGGKLRLIGPKTEGGIFYILWQKDYN